MRWLVAALLALFLIGCTGGEQVDPDFGAVRYYHDDVHGVGCWTAWSEAIDCMPDSEYRSVQP